MKIWFDTEFLDLGDTVELLSLGAVREDGKTFYMERGACPVHLANDWVWKNVMPHLESNGSTDEDMRISFREFCGTRPEFWAYYATYDAMLLFKLYGGFMGFPWNQVVHDISTLAMLKGVYQHEFPPQQSVAHHALNDAIWNKEVYDYIWFASANRT